MRVLIILACAWLVSCAPLPESDYAAADGGSYGYSERHLHSGRIAVSFVGNSQTPRETVEAYAFLRAAEVAEAHGRTRFALIDKTVVIQTFEELIYPSTFAYRGIYWDYDTGYPVRHWPIAPPHVRPVTNFAVTLIIRPFDGAVPEGTISVFDARELKGTANPKLTP